MLVKLLLTTLVLFLILPVILSVPIQTFMKDQKEAETSNTPHIVEFCPLNEWYWGFKALSKCGNTSYYHCLATNEGRFVEFCNESSTWIEKGTYAVFSFANNSIVPQPCPSGTYQPTGRWSHESTSLCEKKMSACVGIGEVVCDDGNVTSDRQCRCDYADNWRMEHLIQENPLNTSCVLPSQIEFMCVRFKCPDGRELDPAYKCVEKCQEGFHRPNGSFQCLPISNSESGETITTSIPSEFTTKKPKIELHPVVRLTQNQVVLVLPIAVAIVVVVSACSVLMSKCKKNSSTEKQLQNLAKKKLFERQARKKHRLKLERNRRRSEKKDRLQVKVDKALQKMEERQRIRKEKKRLLQLGENQADGACGNTDDLNHVTVEI